MGEAIMPDTLIQPFRRNLLVDPVIIPIGVGAAIATAVANMTGKGVTTFKMYNPTPYWVWYAGWGGAATDMPTIKEKGHYIAPGMVEVNRTQMPQWIGAIADDEPSAPLGNTTGQRLRLVMIYGSGA